jgi:Dockerin type I domain
VFRDEHAHGISGGRRSSHGRHQVSGVPGHSRVRAKGKNENGNSAHHRHRFCRRRASSGAGYSDVQFIPGAGIDPTLLNNYDPALPGCYGLSTTTPLITPGAAEDWGTLTINYPDVLPSNFTGDFFITLSTAVPDGHGGFTAGAALNETWVKVRTPLVCDVNQDGIIDSDDISLIIGAIGSNADPKSLYDFDGDGQITVLDARGCVGRCTNPNCAK